MLTLIWLLVWLIQDTPDVAIFGPWNDWGTALTVCVVIDIIAVPGVRRP